MKRIAATLILLGAFAAEGFGRKFYDDDPLIREPKTRRVEAKTRKISDYYDLFWHTLATPGEKQRHSDPIRAQAVNTLGDPFEGAWWEPRHYWRPMSLSELRSGPANDSGPAVDGAWVVTSAKTEGITPGFVILDRHGKRYFVKFDPPCNPEMATGADLIATRIFYALGYHVPENHIVYFLPEQLKVGEDAESVDQFGRKHKMSRQDLDAILARIPPGADGRYRATASLAVPGKPIGPYRYFGTRSDDPNDTTPHEHRRDLRGLFLASALVDHDDSRAINTFDALVPGPSGPFVKHYQLDLGSTLGSGSTKPNSPRSGGEYLFSWRNAAVQFFTLGLAVPKWARATYPDLEAVGRFESATFDSDRWVPEYPNPAFLNRLPDDEFWMAKQIVNLRDEEIRAIVDAARYSDPRATDWITKRLIERRDKIGRSAFAKVLPVDRFQLRNGQLEWEDLPAVYGLGPSTELRVRWAVFDNESETAEEIPGATSARLPEMQGDGYWVAVLESPQRPRQSTRVYVRKCGEAAKIVGLDRTW